MNRAVACLCAVVCWAATTTAYAGGLYLTPRGVRPLARAGAYVAGAEDAGALWYNPAGLAETKNGFLMDGTLTIFRGKYTRVGPDGQEMTTVKADPNKLPIPTFAVTHDLGTRRAMFAVGVLAPNLVSLNWPREVDNGMGQTIAAPQRYSLIGMSGSIYAHVVLGAAVKLPKGFSLGVDVQLIPGKLQLETVMSACDGAVCAFPEDPEFDANATLGLNFVTATASLGMAYEYGPLRIGGSFMTPYQMKGNADLDVIVPSHPLFENASVDGNKAHIGLDFPWIARGGVQLKPFELLTMEVAFVWEQWSRQQSIEVRPQNVVMRNVRGIGDYEVGNISIKREMQDVYSIRGGGELKLGRSGLSLLGGLAWENGAFKDKTLSPMTLDSDKFILGGGIGFEVGRAVRVDMSMALVFMNNRSVTTSTVEQPTAIRPTPPGDPNIIANGNYNMRATVLGIGMTMYP